MLLRASRIAHTGVPHRYIPPFLNNTKQFNKHTILYTTTPCVSLGVPDVR
jgi:hypothetical protein